MSTTQIRMKVPTFVSSWVPTLLAIGLAACGLTEVESDPLVGNWRITVPGDYEATFRFTADGAFVIVEADFGFEDCSTESGTWRTDAGVLSIEVTMIDGDVVSETVDVPFDLSGDTLTLNWADEDTEILTRFGAAVDCASYGWPPSTAADMASDHEYVVSFLPGHEQSGVPLTTQITLQLAADIPFSSSEVYVELFGVNNDREGCIMDLSGFRCGDLSSSDSFLLLYGVVNGDISTGEIVFGSSAIASDNSVVIRPERPLIGGITYVVHVFADTPSYAFHTWWIFKT